MTDAEHPGVSVVLDLNDLELTTALWSAALGYPLQRVLQQEPNCIGSHCWYLMADPEGNEFCCVGD